MKRGEAAGKGSNPKYIPKFYARNWTDTSATFTNSTTARNRKVGFSIARLQRDKVISAPAKKTDLFTVPGVSLITERRYNRIPLLYFRARRGVWGSWPKITRLWGSRLVFALNADSP